MGKQVSIDQTRHEIREMFYKWGIDPSEWEITYQEEQLTTGVRRRLPGATIRYMRGGKWQTVSCFSKWDRNTNLRQLYLFLDRIRMGEKVGIQYQGLSYTKEVATTANGNGERERKEELLDAYDFLGASPDDPVDLIKDLYRKKSTYYHPDKAGGNGEKFKKLTASYELIMKSRNERP
jgi:hypothetical protein